MTAEVQQLKDGNRKTIEILYLKYKSGFLLFLSKYELSDDDKLDIYQDSVIALIENARKGLLDDLKVELKTYLFSIGKFMAFRRLKQIPESPLENIEWYEVEKEDFSEELETGLKKLGKRCYEILRLFYYEEKKLDEIQSLLEYEKKEVLKSQKSRCLKQLKEIIENE